MLTGPAAAGERQEAVRTAPFISTCESAPVISSTAPREWAMATSMVVVVMMLGDRILPEISSLNRRWKEIRTREALKADLGVDLPWGTLFKVQGLNIIQPKA